MPRTPIGIASLALCLILSAPAQAQSTGNGLYEPFPRASSLHRAERFVHRLEGDGRATSTGELERGAFRGRTLPPAARAPATARATGLAGPPPAAWLLTAALLAIAVAAAGRARPRIHA